MANQVAYGFYEIKDLFADRVVNNIQVVSDAIQRSVDEHNRQMDALLGLFVRRTTQYSIRYRTSKAARLQPLDDNGRARPTKLAGHYDLAFPLQSGGAAWGANYVTLQKMTVQEANDETNSLLAADARWMRDHILGGLFASSTWTFTDDAYGALTIQPLANGDSVTYLQTLGSDAGATDTHQLAQASDIGNSNNPFPTIYRELNEHPENQGGPIVALVASDLRDDIELLSTFRPINDPNIRAGANTDVLVGNLGVALPGPLFGYTDAKVWVAEWPSLPSGYMIAVATGGDPALAMREDPEPELRGFKQVAVRPDYPFEERQYLRRAGFGAYNRVGAVAYLVGNGSYSVPSGYTVPMP